MKIDIVWSRWRPIGSYCIDRLDTAYMLQEDNEVIYNVSYCIDVVTMHFDNKLCQNEGMDCMGRLNDKLF